MAVDCGKDEKSVGGTCIPRSKFLHVGDPADKETWKLPVHDDSHIQNALSRFNQTEGIPAGKKAALARRLAQMAAKRGMKVDEFRKHLSENGLDNDDLSMIFAPSSSARIFACDLLTLSEPTLPSETGESTQTIPLAYTGTFYKDGDRFQITRSDLMSIVRNFKKKGTGTVNVDYEHASEQPEVAKAGPVPAAGWINNVWMDESDPDNPMLMGETNWNEPANHLIRTKQYRFFSPAIDWSATDKETGTPQGATLTSAALTNRPFLEKLPPLLMTESPRVLVEQVVASPKETITMADKKLRMKKSADGKLQVHKPSDNDGDEGKFGELMGEIEPADFAKCAETGEDMSEKSMMAAKGCMSEVVGKELGLGGPVEMSDVKKFYEAGKQATQMTEAQQGQKLLASTVTPTGVDKRKARTLLSEGKVSPQQYAAFENATELVDQGVKEGKIHPTQREYYMSDAIIRPAEFEKMLTDAKPYIQLTEQGLSGVDPQGRTTQFNERDRIGAAVKEYRKEHKGCSYREALKAVTRGDEALGARLREEGRNSRLM